MLNSAVRLVNGTQRSGRLETLMGGEWVGVAVYDARNRQSVAAQACRILGFPATTEPPVVPPVANPYPPSPPLIQRRLMEATASNAPAIVEAPDAFGAPSVQRWLNTTHCEGYERALSECPCTTPFTYGRFACGGKVVTGIPAAAQLAITCPDTQGTVLVQSV